MSVRGIEAMGEATYCVVFYGAQMPFAWWTRGLNQRFAHVEVWWHIGDDCWVAVRPNYCYLSCDVMHGAPREGDNGVTHTRVLRCRREKTSPMVPFGMKTCVSVVKAVTGIRAAWVLTPRQLYNYLSTKAVI
jgi:hypothetical protein